ncbi:MAG: primosomal protein N' [Bacteroidales bacterium]|nr:primosomal protein N' [Bacteroidales bacterium]MCF8405577.1 primosomal protein N' [Bacteroidales bacterium]
MDRTTLFVDVLLPLPVAGTFTYRVPYDLNPSVEKWKRVVVQFGKKKVYTAIVVNIHSTPPKNFQVKYILSVIDAAPVMNEIQFTFWKWISSYYMSEIGEVMNAAIPSALKLASETQIRLNPDFDGNVDILPEKEFLIVEALDIQQKLTLTEIENIVEQKKVIPIIKSLYEKGVVSLEEEIKDRYKPKTETYIRLSRDYKNDDQLQPLFTELEKRAFRQVEVLMAYISLSGFGQGSEKPVKQAAISSKVKSPTAAISSLVKKGVLETYQTEVSRLEGAEATDEVENIELSPDQLNALSQINTGLSDKKVVLFHGVTSSGKTEIYIKLIEKAISLGKQVLYLLPEIALTTQIINRLRKYFGEKVGVYHSKYNQNERLEIWQHVLSESVTSSKYQIILGPRSALFLPFSKLGLIIVDEEHDYSYKQYDPAPRYHARDGAIYLASMHNANVVLGSATPSMESYFNAKTSKYTLVELNSRFGDVQMPEILVADIKRETREKTMRSHFSGFLIDHINEALENKEQVILFQNRRGYSLRLECDTCNWMPECKNCDVTLIYHKHNNQLKCHYCGYSRRVPERCDACGGTHLKMKGFGTEKLEDDLAILYPDARIKRMDLDTTRSKFAYQHIINDFENRRIDILVGTQMVTKGLDFDNVSIVGIMNADSMICFPDFRSYERSYQLMAQVSGRAGRKNKRGKVIIQAYNPYHSVIRDVIANDYQSMYSSQILERRNFNYPPFYRLVYVSLKHKDARLLNEGARELAIILRDQFGNRILGPEYPLIAKIKNLYIKRILIKLERDDQLLNNKKSIADLIDKFHSQAIYRNIRAVIDVDPV